MFYACDHPYQDERQNEANFDAPEWLSKMRGSRYGSSARHTVRNPHSSTDLSLSALPAQAEAGSGERRQGEPKTKPLDYSRYECDTHSLVDLFLDWLCWQHLSNLEFCAFQIRQGHLPSTRIPGSPRLSCVHSAPPTKLRRFAASRARERCHADLVLRSAPCCGSLALQCM
jgi:hypothetical protein